MSKKRMVLEEVEEKNLCVPGTPENPIKLGERAKSLLVRMHIAEQGKTNPFGRNEYDEGGKSSAAFDQLVFLKLVEERNLYTDAEIDAKLQVAAVERAEHAHIILSGGKDNRAWGYQYVDAEINKRVHRLTDDGRSLLLAGIVTVIL